MVKKKKRTRLPAIRTIVEPNVQCAILNPEHTYQKIAPKIEQLLALGMSSFAIHKALGISFGTVKKAVGWIEQKNSSG